jgi:ornithine cyclodeaminase
MLILDAEAAAAALPFGALVRALRDRHAAGATVPPRAVHTVALADGSTGTLLVMPAWCDEGFLAVKSVMVAPGNAALGLPAVQASVLLSDARTGVPIAVIDGAELTARRTAATAALAASLLLDTARPRRLLVVGAGRIAALLPAAYAAVLPLAEVVVWARRPGEAARLAAGLEAAGVVWARRPGESARLAAGLEAPGAAPVRAVADLEAAVHDADLIACATLAHEPLVRGAWLHGHAHLALVGSFTPAMREADTAAFAGAHLVVDSQEAFEKSGDLIAPLAEGVVQRAAPGQALAERCREAAAGRAPTPVVGRSVYKSVGSALQDLAAAMLAVAPRH